MAEKKDNNRVITPVGSGSRPIQINEEPRHNGIYNQREEIFEVLPLRSIPPRIARISHSEYVGLLHNYILRAQSIQRKLELIGEELDRVKNEIDGLLHGNFFSPRSNTPITWEEEEFCSSEEEEEVEEEEEFCSSEEEEEVEEEEEFCSSEEEEHQPKGKASA